MRRIVITGLGLVTSIGDGVEDTWNNLLSLKSGIKKISSFNTENLPCKIAGFINHDSKEENYFNFEKYFSTKEINRNDRFILYGLAAAEQAIKDSGFDNKNESLMLKSGVTIGSGIGGLETIFNGSITLNQKGPRRISPFFIPSSLVNLLSGQVSIKFGLKGPNHSVVTACATGAHSIGDGAELIKRGAADIMVAGGSEAAVCELGIAGFCAARSLSTHFNNDPNLASRPWDKDRDGFVMGEGSGVLVLEELNHAKKRGAKIYAEIVGYGMSGDAYHITSPSLNGDGGLRAMQNALKMAKLDPNDIDYVNAHGTSTMIGDDIELEAILNLIKNDKIKISSTKSSIGHLLGAAGSVEAIFSILSIINNTAPATLNLENQSSDHKVDLIPKKPKEFNINYALSNSFGFGGTNTALVFKKF